MILVLLLPLFIPVSGRIEAAPEVIGADNFNALMFDVAEYEDPELALYKLAALGIIPALTLLEIQNKPAEGPSEDDIAYFEQLAEVKKGLEEVIERLHGARSKLEQGSHHIFVDLDKSILGLKRLERQLKPKLPSVKGSMRQSISFHTDGWNPVFKTEGERTMTTLEPLDAGNPDHSAKKEETVTKTPFGEEIYITEAKKVGGGDVKAFQKKWTWKSSSII